MKSPKKFKSLSQRTPTKKNKGGFISLPTSYKVPKHHLLDAKSPPKTILIDSMSPLKPPTMKTSPKQKSPTTKKKTSPPPKKKTSPLTKKKKEPRIPPKKVGGKYALYSLQQSPKLKLKTNSLPIKLSGVPPKFAKKSFDELFWIDYKQGMNIHNYVEKQIKKYKLEMASVPKEKGQLCKMDKSQLKLFPYQIVDTVLGSPYSPLTRLLIIASTGTGKSCILVGIANYHVIHEHKHGIIFVGATDALYTNFIKQSMECPGKMKEIASEHGWTDSINTDHVQQFSTFMKKYIYPIDYTKFANMISGKYKKYQGLESLKGKVILLDEAHYLVDSMSEETYAPTFQRMPKSWQMNLREMYKLLSDPTNPSLDGAILVGATATPITQSIMEYFALVNLFAHKPLPKEELQTLLKTVDHVEQGIEPDSKLNDCIKQIQPIVKDSVAMYTAKTSKKVLDTSIFPQMEFSQINVPLTSEQARLIYVPKNHLMHQLK